MRKLERRTGTSKLSAEDTKIYSLATRSKPAHCDPPKPGLPPDYQAIEAPFIDQHGGYYYLFDSHDLSCRGTRATSEQWWDARAKSQAPTWMQKER